MRKASSRTQIYQPWQVYLGSCLSSAPLTEVTCGDHANTQ